MDIETIRAVMRVGNHSEEMKEQNRRIMYLRNRGVSFPTKYKLLSPLNHVSIAIDGGNFKSANSLINSDKLMGWCWQSCEFISPIIPYKTDVVRGVLEMFDGDKYEHSWLEITRKNKVFVFDPCFNILCLKEDYDKVFKTKIKYKIDSKEIKKELIKLSDSSFVDNILVDGTNSIEDIFYRTDARYEIKYKKDKIKKIKVRFFGNA